LIRDSPATFSRLNRFLSVFNIARSGKGRKVRSSGYHARSTFGFGRSWTPMVRILILANGGIFLAELLFGDPLLLAFGLDTAHPFQIWRYVTYLFLHSPANLFHLLFNMFALWIFGSDMEDYFGPKKFLEYYFFTGIGAGLSVVAVDLLMGRHSFVIGASGAVFGLLLAFGVVYAERRITMLLFFVVPITMKAKHFVILFGVLEFLFGVSGGSQVAHFAHLGGMAFGLLYLKMPGGLFRGKGLPDLKGVRGRIENAMSARNDRRMDDLLRKVNREGIQSLTEEEKQFLHRMSRSKKWQ
jgi:membrane associated rhomboid family serine protease